MMGVKCPCGKEMRYFPEERLYTCACGFSIKEINLEGIKGLYLIWQKSKPKRPKIYECQCGANFGYQEGDVRLDCPSCGFRIGTNLWTIAKPEALRLLYMNYLNSNPEREHYDSKNLKQGTKFDSNKIMMELIPPEAMLYLGISLTHGAKKYAAENWRKGIKYKRLIGGIKRHLAAFEAGEALDPDSGIPHIGSALFGLACLATFEEHIEYKEFDDRHKYPVACTPHSCQDLVNKVTEKC